MNTLRHSCLGLISSFVLALPMSGHAQSPADPQFGPDRASMMQPPPAPRDLPCHEHMEAAPAFLPGLNLDEAQQDKVFAIMHAQASPLREQQKAHRKAQEALTALARSGQYTDAKAKSLTDAIGRASSEIALIRAHSESQIFAVLTPEQRSRLEKMPRPPHERPGRPEHGRGPH